jgi:hypothetical protein
VKPNSVISALIAVINTIIVSTTVLPVTTTRVVNRAGTITLLDLAVVGILVEQSRLRRLVPVDLAWHGMELFPGLWGHPFLVLPGHLRPGLVSVILILMMVFVPTVQGKLCLLESRNAGNMFISS